MIQKQKEFTIMTDGQLSANQFTLKQENLAHVFNILRNNLYSDKPLACFREYGTNATDANKENGNGHIPIEVTIPTIFDPVLKIRDFGAGLSEQDIFEVYASYGASTKRTSNEYVGTLGMGSKSAFGYADSFTVTSYHGGTKKVYEAYIDETKIGAIAKIHEEPSSEPTGICVTIAVNAKDINQFKQTGINFFTFFEPMPVFHGINIAEDIKAVKDSMNFIYQSDLCMIYRDKTWRSYGTVKVKMGNIVYPVNDLKGLDVEWLSSNDNLIINVNIGDVSFTTSRESLEMSEDTIKTLNDKINQIRLSVVKHYQQEIDKCKTPWEALGFYDNSMDRTVKGLLANSLVWRKQKLSTDFLNKLTWTDYQTRSNQWRNSYSVVKGQTNIAMIVDDGGYPTSQTRARLMSVRDQLLSEKKWTRIVFGKGTKEATLDFLSHKELDGAKVIKLSSVSSNTIKKTKSAKAKEESVFVWNQNSYFPYSNCWDSTSVDSDKVKVYVTIESFKPNEYSFSDLRTIKLNLASLGIEIDIYGAKKNAKLDDTWISLPNFLKEKATEIVSDKEFVTNYINSKVADEIRHNTFMSFVLKGSYKAHMDDVKCPVFKKLNQFTINALSDKFKAQQKIVAYTYTYADLGDLSKEYAKVLEEYKENLNFIAENYPLILDTYTYLVNSVKAKQHVDYVNLVFEANEKLASIKSRPKVAKNGFPVFTV